MDIRKIKIAGLWLGVICAISLPIGLSLLLSKMAEHYNVPFEYFLIYVDFILFCIIGDCFIYHEIYKKKLGFGVPFLFADYFSIVLMSWVIVIFEVINWELLLLIFIARIAIIAIFLYLTRSLHKSNFEHPAAARTPAEPIYAEVNMNMNSRP